MTDPTILAENVIHIPSSELHESPFNPRKRFNERKLQELATDIEQQGILSPLLVRARPPLRWERADGELVVQEQPGYEIVFGHRRYRAALLAAQEACPCIVRDMADEDVKRAQISENLQRDDVHPIEEAEGFQALLDDDPQLTADKLAEEFGRSRSYVYGRLKLLQAIPEVREACLSDEYGADIALLIARLRTEKFQLKALEYIRKDYRASLTDGGKQSFRSVRNLLNEKFALSLKKTLFDCEDATLVPGAGTCSACPKRAGNAPEFEDIANPSTKRDRYGMREDYIPHDGADVCTDPDCFDAKKAAHHKRRSAELQAQGKTVVDGNKARGAVSAHGEVKGAYIALADVKKALPKGKSKKKDAAAPELPVVQILDPRTDKVYQAVRREDIKAAGLVLPMPKKENESWAEQNRRQEAERKANEPLAAAEQKARQAAFLAIRELIPRTARSGLDARLVARVAFKGVQNWAAKSALVRLWGLKREESLEAAIESTMTDDQIALFMLDCALIDDTIANTYSFKKKPARLLNAAGHYGVDLEDLRSRALRGEDLSTPSTAARALIDADDEEVDEDDVGETVNDAPDGAGDDFVLEAPGSFAELECQAVDAGSAGEEAKDEPADAGLAPERDPNTSDMFEGEQA